MTDCPQNVKEMNNEVPRWHKTYVVEYSHISPVKKDVALKRTCDWKLRTVQCQMVKKTLKNPKAGKGCWPLTNQTPQTLSRAMPSSWLKQIPFVYVHCDEISFFKNWLSLKYGLWFWPKTHSLSWLKSQ